MDIAAGKYSRTGCWSSVSRTPNLTIRTAVKSVKIIKSRYMTWKCYFKRLRKFKVAWETAYEWRVGIYARCSGTLGLPTPKKEEMGKNSSSGRPNGSDIEIHVVYNNNYTYKLVRLEYQLDYTSAYRLRFRLQAKLIIVLEIIPKLRLCYDRPIYSQ